MKTKRILILALYLSLLSGITYSQTISGPMTIISTSDLQETVKYGALAIERDNGIYFGWAVDCTTLEEAQKKAVEECTKKGGKCSVVLSFSGTCCAAYRTSAGKNIGLAFGWGLAKTKEEADVIAKREHLLRSYGMAAPNITYGCNSANSGNMKQIYNASVEIQSLPGEEEDY
jgi:hypothetical protein